MATIYTLDINTFNKIFSTHDIDNPDPWKRVAAYQYSIDYDNVTLKHRTSMKSIYYAYVYGCDARKMGELLDQTPAYLITTSGE